MNTNGEEANEDDDDLARERDLLAFLIEKLKYEIDDIKNHNKLFESSNKTLVDKLKSEIEDFKNKYKCLKSSLKKYKASNTKLANNNQLMSKDIDKFQIELARYNDVNYALEVETECAKAKGLLQSQEQIKHDKVWKQKESSSFQELNVKYFEIQDLKVQLQDKSIAIRVISTTSVSRPQLKSNRLEDRVLHNNSQGKMKEVEDHRRNFKIKQPIAVPISTREPKRIVNQFVATPYKRTVASKSANQTPRSVLRKLYEHVSKTCSWWYPKLTPPGYKWIAKSITRNVKMNVSFPFRIKSRTSNNSEPKTIRKSNLSNTPLTFNSFVARRDNPVHHRRWELKAHDGQSQASNLRECHYQKGVLHQWAESQFILCSCGTDLYSTTLQDINSPNLICLIAKDSSSQAWLWHRCLSHLNFDSINLLSKYDIVTSLPKLKFFKDHLCSSFELGKAKRKSFKTKTIPSSKRRLQLLHMDLCGFMRVESINGKKYMLVIIDDYSRYTWTHFLRSKDETPEVLIDFLRLVQRGLHAQVRTVRTDKGTKFLNKNLHAYFAKEGINHQTSIARTPKQNGVVERRNHPLVEATRTMLSAAKVPLFFWAEAMATACFTQNRSLVIPRYEKTPYHIING
ncbi:retrovirus-related pol polyprotein from transposon TNT 1-94 [Tanacetum coccineum]